MRICLVSDLHLEFGNYPFAASKKLGDGGDVLIIAGDLTCSRYFNLKRTDSDARSQRKRLDKFIKEWTTKFDKTFYVMGNHEHYGYVLDSSSKVLQQYLQDTNVTILDPGAAIHKDILFIGATLWTDYNNNDFDTKSLIRYSMNDYRVIHSVHPDKISYEGRKHSDQNIKYGIITPDYILEKHWRDLTFLEWQLKNISGLKTVVITHHAPHLDFNGDHSTGLIHAYCTDLTELIEKNKQIALWVCGHTHHNIDFSIGPTRLVSNCRGYVGETVEKTFAPKFIEI